MWKLSSEAEKEVNALHERMRRPSLLSGSRKTVGLIEQLVSRNQPAVIPAVASGLFSSTKVIHDASSAGIAFLLKLVPSIELIRLNESLGGYYWGYVSERWNKIKPEEVRSFLASTSDKSVGNLLSFHKNGYVRHAAIEFLSQVMSGEELRFLLIRQNDWVASISEDAQAMVRNRITSDYLCHFASETDLLFHLLKCKRRDLSKTVSSYIDLLIEPEHRDQIHSAVSFCCKRTGRLFVRHLLGRDGDHLAETVRAGLASSDSVVRTNCLKRAFDCLEKDECNAVVENLLSDKFIHVRIEANELKAKLSSSVEVVWRRCMFDKSRALRETAMFYLRKSNCDVAELYRSKLADSPNSLPALSGLVSSGDASDLQVFLGYMESPLASRRAEAVRGVGQVGSKSEVLLVQKMLLDESTRVVRAAYQQLQPIAKTVDSGFLFGLLEKCKATAGYDAILRLLMEKGRWASLNYLIRSSGSSNQTLADQAMTLVDFTFSQNRVFTQPSLEQRTQIQLAIDESRASIDEVFFQNVSSYLSSFGFSFPA